MAARADAADNFCFGPTILRSVPNPVFDGNINGEGSGGPADNGWLNSFLYRGGNGVPDANILLQGNNFTDSGGHQWLALGVTALNDTEWDKGDAVVILFKQAAPGTGYTQIVISPLQDSSAPATAAANAKPGTSDYATSTDGHFWTPSLGQAPSWVTWGSVGVPSGGACSAAQHGTNCKWTAEIGIDLTAAQPTGLGPDVSASGKFYVDVIEIFDHSSTTNNYQFSWPPGHTLAADPSDKTITPDPSVWGGLSLSASSCAGVFVGYPDISASPTNIDGTLQNGTLTTFTAKIHNSGANANGVVAHFSHAPFGVCGLVDSCFQPFSAGGTTVAVSCPNGAAPPNCCGGTQGCIPPDQPGNVGTGFQEQWTVDPQGDKNKLHQCIRVKLEATVGGTQFNSSGDFHNMEIDHASTANSVATINMQGVPAPEGGGTNQRVRLYTHKATQYAYADGRLPDIPMGTLTEQLLIQNRTFRFTGKHVTVSGVRSDNWDPVGSYGNTIQHERDATFAQGFYTRHQKLIDGICGINQPPPPDMTPTCSSVGDQCSEARSCCQGLFCFDGRCNFPIGSRRAQAPRPAAAVHANVTTLAQCLQVVELVNAINDALTDDPETPPLADWTTSVGGVTSLNPNGNEAEVSVPVGGVVTLPSTFNYVGGGGACKGCLCCFNTGQKTTPAAGATAALIVLVGLFAHRRRRRP
jgi:MYXO-CTERM domain-containing protein